MWSSNIDFSLVPIHSFSRLRSRSSFQNRNLITILSTIQNLQWFWKVRIKTRLINIPYKALHVWQNSLILWDPARQAFSSLNLPYPFLSQGLCTCCSLSSWPCSCLFAQAELTHRFLREHFFPLISSHSIVTLCWYLCITSPSPLLDW